MTSSSCGRLCIVIVKLRSAFFWSGYGVRARWLWERDSIGSKDIGAYVVAMNLCDGPFRRIDSKQGIKG